VATLGGVYAAGDDVRGPDLIVTAIAAGRKAAQAMDDYLRAIPTDVNPIKGAA